MKYESLQSQLILIKRKKLKKENIKLFFFYYILFNYLITPSYLKVLCKCILYHCQLCIVHRPTHHCTHNVQVLARAYACVRLYVYCVCVCASVCIISTHSQRALQLLQQLLRLCLFRCLSLASAPLPSLSLSLLIYIWLCVSDNYQQITKRT